MRRLICLMALAVMSIAYANESKAQLVADFTANITSGCSPILVQFTDHSTGNPTSWLWDLGNGTTSTLQHPSTTYFTAGSYTVVLTVSNGSGSNTKTVVSYINVVASPVVNFTATDSGLACAPATYSFTSNAVAGGSGAPSYLWDFGDGLTSTAANPTHSYSATGNYTVTLSVTNSAGCANVKTKTNFIQLISFPVASFTVSNNASCSAPLTATFTNTSIGAATYQWDFGDGGTSTAANPTHAYAPAGNYTATLVVTNIAGCKDTAVVPAAVSIGSLTASFTKSTPAACVNNAISFTNTSLPGPGVSTWYFGDGSQFAGTNASHAYSTPGTYTVKLVVNFNNCSDSTTQTVTINSKPATQFSASPLSSCTAPFTTQFTNTSSGATGYLWYFGDGQTSTVAIPAHTYNALGSYTVKLVSYGPNGCNDTLTKNNYISVAQPSMTISYSNPNTCGAPVTVSFSTNTSATVTSYTWNYGDGTIVSGGATSSHTYNAVGVYTVTVSYSTGPGCNFTSSPVTVNVGTMPVAGFSFSPAAPCPNQQVSFTNSTVGSSGTTYTWYFGDGGSSSSANPTRAYTTPGSYTVMLIANNYGCKDTFTLPITISPPTAQFSPVYSCTNRLAVTFNNTSVGGSTYSWNFGDGFFSTQQNPSHTYASYGTYNVTLTVVNTTSGCTSNYIQAVTLFNLDAQFSAVDSNTCTGKPVVFTANSSSFYNSYMWTFGTVNQTTTSNTVTRTFNTTGAYTVTLVVRDIRNCYDTIVKTNYIQVNAHPSANFTAAPVNGCAPLLVNFTDQSSPASVPISNWTWKFGDGGTQNSASANAAHSYTAGTYSVTLKITDANGCVDSLVKASHITVNRPTAAFHSLDTNRCQGQPISFINSSTGTGLSYNWSFGDGNSSSSPNPVHTYSAAGSYSVRLIVTNSSSCSDTLTRTGYINIGNINASFAASDTFANCPPLSVNLANNSTNAVNYTWTFGNGNTSSVTSPSTIYTYPGVYTIKLIAQSSAGCLDSFSSAITVLGPTGNLSYTPQAGCSPLTVQFTSANANAQLFIWDMNNGATQTTSGPSATFTYTNPGMYVPKLILSDGNSCLVPVLGPDTVKVDSVAVDFSYSSGIVCDEGTIQFYDTTLFAVSPVISRNWDFGDGGTAIGHNPSHFYSAPGTYTVTLVAGTTAGCFDTVVKSVTIFSAPVVNAGNDTGFCQGSVTGIQLQATGAANYFWAPSSGLSCTGCPAPIAQPVSTTTYTVIGTAVNGCTDTASVIVTVHPLPAVTAGNGVVLCDGDTAYLQASGAQSYSWAPASGLSCSSCPNPSAAVSTSTNLVVTGTDINGCTDTAQLTIVVNQRPVLVMNANEVICAGDSVQLSPSGASSYSWSPATDLSCTSCNAPFAYPTANSNYTVIGTDLNGCSDTAQVSITVNALPVVNTAPTLAVCAGDSVQLTANGAQTYSWLPATGLSCTTCAGPMASPAATTSYTVTGTDANGCVNSAQLNLTVNTLPVLSFGGNTTICEGDTTQLLVSGAAGYVWSSSATLSCAGCPNPLAAPSTTTTYTVVGTDGNSCIDTAQVTVTVNALPVVTASSGQVICFGDTVQLSAAGASTYSWSPAAGLSCPGCPVTAAAPSATGVYTITGTDPNGCKDTAQVTVQVNALPVINAGTGAGVCIGDSVQLTATGAQTYTWSPVTGLSCTNCSNPVAGPSAGLLYTITGTDQNGCTGTTQVNVTVHPLPVLTVAGTAICQGDTAQLQVSGAVNYTWSPANDLSCANCANPLASPAGTSVYVVSGTDVNGCMDTAQITVTVNPLPTVSISGGQTICSGDSVQLQATGASAYSWSPATGLSCVNCISPLASPGVTTAYILTGTDANGCQDTAHVSIAVNLLPQLSVSPAQNVCVGDSVQLTAAGAQTYTWTPAAGLSCVGCAAPMASPSATTSYLVTGTDVNGCGDTATVAVTVHALPVITTGPDVTICSGTPASLSASGAVSYSWAPATGLSCVSCASPVATPAATTTYVVTGTNAAGCSDTQHVTVHVVSNPVVTIAASQTTLCAGDTSQLQASGAASYSWTPATGLSCTNCANPTAQPAVTTTYILTGTAGNNCIDTAQVTIVVNPLPVLSGASQTVCRGQSVQFLVSGAASYSWAPAAGLSCGNCPAPLVQTDTSINYIVTGTTAAGCSSTLQLGVTVFQLPVVDAGTDQTTCEGAAVSLLATGAANYQWTPATSLSCAGCANPLATPLTTTTYSVAGTDMNGCSDTASVTVHVNPKPIIDAGPDVATCRLDSVVLIVSGGQSYSWAPAASLSCAVCDTVTAFPLVTTNYVVTGTDSLGCSDSDNVTVTVHPTPAISAGTDRTVCKGEVFQLLATGGASYNWSPGTWLSCTACTSPEAIGDSDIVYSVVGIDSNGCSDSDQIVITVIQPRPIEVSEADTLCKGESTRLSATGGDTYLWFPANGLSNPTVPDPVASPDSTTDYAVVIKQGNCFTDTAHVRVMVNPLPVVDAGPDQSVLAGTPVNLAATAQGAALYQWSPATGLSCADCPAPVASPKNNTTYTVMVTSEYGCKAQDDVTVFITCDNSLIFMANTFTPNGDGNNDRYYPQGRGVANVRRFTVYSRWGDIVYDVQNIPPNDYLFGWDGTYKGDFMKPDVFIFIIEAVCDNGQPMQMKGNVALIR